MDRKKKLLAVLMTIWVVLIVYRMATNEEPKRVPLKYVKGQTVSRDKVVPRADSGSMVQVEQFKKGASVALNYSKNIFAPLYTHLPPPPPSPPPPTPVLPPPPPPPTPEELAMEQARRELSQFRYMGYLNRGPGRDQALLAREGSLFIVGKGQIVSGAVFLKEVTSSYVILQEKNTHLEITLTLSGG